MRCSNKAHHSNVVIHFLHSCLTSLFISAYIPPQIVTMSVKAIISPSILASDFARLKDECEDVLSPAGGAAEWLHLDVMDAHFVPNLTFGPPIIKCLRGHLPKAFFDVHLMIAEPAKWVKDYSDAGANMYTFHIEAVADIAAARDLCVQIRECGMQVGVAVKPGTPVEGVFEIIDAGLIDMLLVMTVEPGFGGQKFMVSTMAKVEAARKQYPSLNIQVDGGLAADTIETAAKAGANVIVAGTAIFKAPSRKDATDLLRNTVTAAIPNFPKAA